MINLEADDLYIDCLKKSINYKALNYLKSYRITHFLKSDYSRLITETLLHFSSMPGGRNVN